MNTYFRDFIKISRFNFSSNGAAKIKRGQIVNYEYRVKELPDFSKVHPGSKLNIKLRLARIPTKIKEVMPPQHDFINFNKMSGNEILLNMKNCEYFTKIELIASLLELRKRINMDVNSEFKSFPWHKHVYVSKVLQRLLKNIPGLHLRHTLNATIIFHHFSIKNDFVWKSLEANILKSLHKIKSQQLAYFLDFFDKINRGSQEFFAKMVTILPIHVEFLNLREFTRVFEVCINKNLGTDKLYHIYFLKKLEKNAHRMDFNMYINNLRSLGRRRFDLDNVFYYNYMLPPILSFEYTIEKASIASQTLHFLRENCPAIDFTKYIETFENLIKEFSEKKKEGQDLSKLKLKIKQDLSIVNRQAEEDQDVDAEALQEKLKDHIKNDLGFDNLDNVIEKDDIDEEMLLMKNKAKQKKSKKEEKKEKLKKRNEKRLEKQKQKENESENENEKTKEKVIENQEADESKEIQPHKGPRRRHARVLSTNAPDLETSIKAPKDKTFKADEIVKKNKKYKNEFEEEDSKNRE